MVNSLFGYKYDRVADKQRFVGNPFFDIGGSDRDSLNGFRFGEGFAKFGS